jgi:hypothetical protein
MSEPPDPPVLEAPKWDVPNPYGYAAAVDSMGSISSPLLAATSAALLALVISGQDKIRWPGLALLLLAVATLCFVMTVQLTFWAKQYVVTPAELRDWWPDRLDGEVGWEQRWHKKRHQAWADRSLVAYNVGVLAFLAALPIMLIPPGKAEKISDVRLAAVAVFAAGFLLEVAWIALALRRSLDKVGDG